MSERETKGAWRRLVVALLLATVGGSGFWSVVVALPAVGTAFAIDRAAASVAYAAAMFGSVWPPVMAYFFRTIGWRHTFVALGVFCLATMPPLILALRGRAPIPPDRVGKAAAEYAAEAAASAAFGLTPRRLHIALFVAGIMCCVAMSVPQVHLIAYCRDLGYGTTRGPDMLSVMLTASVVSRVAFGYSADRIGGLANLLIGSTMQAASLILYAFFSSLGALYAISALFGFVQGGIVPCYAMIVREYFPPHEAAARLAPLSVANFIGMSAGAWMAGEIFDLTGAYRDAFLNGAMWNAVNILIISWLLLRLLRRKETTLAIAPTALPPLPGGRGLRS